MISAFAGKANVERMLVQVPKAGHGASQVASPCYSVPLRARTPRAGWAAHLAHTNGAASRQAATPILCQQREHRTVAPTTAGRTAGTVGQRSAGVNIADASPKSQRPTWRARSDLCEPVDVRSGNAQARAIDLQR